MSRYIEVSHLGNRFRWTINEFNENCTGPFNQQITATWNESLFSDIMNDVSITPISNIPFLIRDSNLIPLVSNDFGEHLNQAWKLTAGSISYLNDKIMNIFSGDHFVNPNNGRYFKIIGSLSDPYWEVYNQNDDLISTYQFSEFYIFWINTYLFKDFTAFAEAESWDDALQYVVVLNISPSFQGAGDYLYVPYRITNGNSLNTYAQFLRMLWVWLGGEDSSEEETEEDEDPYTNPDSPYNPSDIGGGDGDGDDPYDPGDNIDIPDDPPFSIADTGLMNVYTPSDVQLNLLAAYLWSNNFVSSLVKELYADPMDVLISLGVLPFNITAGGTTNIKVGDRDSGVSSNYPASKYYTLDCGSVRIGTTIGAYTDYAPYTKGDIFIPYVGFVPFDVDAFMGHTVGLKYKIEICSGSAVAFLTRSGSVWQTFACNVMTSIPLSAANYAQMWQTIVGATVALAGAGAVGAAGLSGATAAGEAAEGAQTISAQSGNVAKSASGIMSAAATKPSIQKSNNIGVMAGLLGNRKPFIELHRPDLILPKGQNMYQGYPSYITAKISELTGYNRISSINLVVPSANAKEMIKIDGILKSGFIVGSGAGLTGSGIVLGRNNSPTHQIKKSVEKIIELTGTFRDAVDVMNPVIRIQYNSPISFNYVYIEAFQRAYYVENVNMLRNNIMEISLSVDVLGSFAGEILENSAIIDKSESKYNLYLNDDSIKMSQKPLITNIEFPNGFFENNAFEYVLLVAGN